MKLLLNREIPLVDADLESKPHWLWVNYDAVLAQKINLAAEEARNRANKASEKEKLLRLLDEKQNEALRALTPEEIQERLKALA